MKLIQLGLTNLKSFFFNELKCGLVKEGGTSPFEIVKKQI